MATRFRDENEEAPKPEGMTVISKPDHVYRVKCTHVPDINVMANLLETRAPLEMSISRKPIEPEPWYKTMERCMVSPLLIVSTRLSTSVNPTASVGNLSTNPSKSSPNNVPPSKPNRAASNEDSRFNFSK